MYSGKIIEELIRCVESVQGKDRGLPVPPKFGPESTGSTFMLMRNFLGQYQKVRVA